MENWTWLVDREPTAQSGARQNHADAGLEDRALPGNRQAD